MRTRGIRLARSLRFSYISDSWEALRSTYFSTKETFENHKVAFTIGTSISSVATAWAGFTLRHHHQSKLDSRLESIEKALQASTQLERSEIRKLVDWGNSKTALWMTFATGTFIGGYVLGWRGGRWYANRKMREKVKPSNRWQRLSKIRAEGIQIQSLRKPLALPRSQNEVPGLPSPQNDFVVK